MPGVYWTESEFDGQYATCGPNSLAMAVCWAEQRYIGEAHPGKTATEVIYHKMVAAGRCSQSGASTGAGLEQQAKADGYRIWRHGFQDPIPQAQWVSILKQRLSEPAVAVMELAHGAALGNELTNHREDAGPELSYHYICVCKYHPGGWSSVAGRDLPEGFWVADGDSDDNNPVVRGERTRIRGGNTLQFYTVPTLAAARPCELLVVYPKGVVGMAGWTDDGKTLTAPNGVKVVNGFRAWIRSHDWDVDDVPLEAEHPDGNGGSAQLFAKSMLTYDQQNGVRLAPIGNQWQAATKTLATIEQEAAAKDQQIAALSAQVANLDAMLTQASGGINQNLDQKQGSLQRKAFNPYDPQRLAIRGEGTPAPAGTPGASGSVGANQNDDMVDDHPLSSELSGLGATIEQDVGGPAKSDIKITQKQMPETYVSADRKSISAQRLYRWTVGGEQALLILAALAGFTPAFLSLFSGDLGAMLAPLVGYAEIVVTAALAGTVAIRVFRTSNHPDVDWFDARILAEEVQSQSWRYAMGAQPYQASSASPDEGISSALELKFMEQIEQLRQGSSVALDTLSDKQNVKQLTDALKKLRDSDLKTRMDVYLRDRLADQAKWYRGKAVKYQKKARNWNRMILLIEALALVAAAVHYFGLPSLDLFGLAGTIIAGAGVWLQMQQFATLSRRYSSMARNLEGYVDVLTLTKEISPEAWGQIVDHVEGLMEREHQGWLALYQHLRLPGQDASTGPTGLPDLSTLPSQVKQTVGSMARR